jgi:hypothetical protein
MATTNGWLFHLTDGIPLTPDRDPFFDGEDGVITYRPPDNSVPEIDPNLPPTDDSLINQQTAEAAKSTPTANGGSAGASAPARTPAEPLLKKLKNKLVHRRTLVISFTLTAPAHVRLIGRRKGRIVASTPAKLLKPGHHTIALTLDPRAWPTSIQFHATPVSTSGALVEMPSGKSEGPLAADSVETP